jgi:lysozyme
MTQIKGIDVYYDNGPVDWAKVKAAGYQFAFIKATEGTNYSHVDYFRNQAPKALGFGLDVGSYHYANFGTVPEAIVQARYFISVVKDFKLTYPLALDLEINKKKVSKKQLTDAAIAFMDYIINAGYQTILYTYDSFLDEQLDESRLTKYPKWLAHYGGQLKNAADIWQYSETGKVDGVSGNVDLNIAYRDFAPKPAQVPVKSEQSNTPAKPLQQIGVVTATAHTVVRKGPNAAYDIVKSIEKGDAFKAYDLRFGWYNVGSGWVSDNYVTFKKI